MLDYKDKDLIEFSFKDLTDFTREDLQNYIVDFCKYKSLLDKRVNKLFSMNTWLYEYTTKEDVKQEIILILLSKAINKLPYLSGEEKLKYFNTVVSNTILTIIKDNVNTLDTILDENFVFSSIYNQVDETQQDKIKDIFDLFINEHLERKLIELYYQGFKDKEIMEVLELGRYQFETIRENIRNKLVENGYYYLDI